MQIGIGLPTTIPGAIRAYGDGDVGGDEINVWPPAAGFGQLRRLADALG